jgi:hypothetical protein
MKINRTSLLSVTVLAVAVSLLAACAAGPVPLEKLGEWDVVVISDSSLWGVAEPYARLIEQDGGVKVNIHDEWEGGLSAVSILKALRGDPGGSAQREKWPQLIRDAEVLVLFGNPVDSLDFEIHDAGLRCVEGIDPGEMDLGTEAFAPYRADLDAIYGEIAKLREGRPLILRATDIYNPMISEWREKGIEDACGAFWEGLSAAARQAAEKNGVTFVSVYDEFNGPSHDQDPREQGLIREDGEHPSEAGAQRYAELLQRSGYGAWVAEQR